MREGVHSFYTVMFTLSRRRRANHNTPGFSVKTGPTLCLSPSSLRRGLQWLPRRRVSSLIGSPNHTKKDKRLCFSLRFYRPLM